MAVAAPIARSRRGRTDGAAGARERILDAASRLVYEEGIQAVGIQRIIGEANAVKASLYAHFKSKDDVVAVFLEREHDFVLGSIETVRLGLTGLWKCSRMLAA